MELERSRMEEAEEIRERYELSMERIQACLLYTSSGG